MLRVKDNVDLKKLEDYGFEEEEHEYFYYCFTEPNDMSELRIYVDKNKRTISTGIDRYVSPYKIHDKIFDLINDGIIEKVKE